MVSGVHSELIQVSLLETKSYSKPHHSAAQRICSCVLNRIFHITLNTLLTFNCKCGTFLVHAFPVSFVKDFQTLCFKLHKFQCTKHA